MQTMFDSDDQKCVADMQLLCNADSHTTGGTCVGNMPTYVERNFCPIGERENSAYYVRWQNKMTLENAIETCNSLPNCVAFPYRRLDNQPGKAGPFYMTKKTSELKMGHGWNRAPKTTEYNAWDCHRFTVMEKK